MDARGSRKYALCYEYIRSFGDGRLCPSRDVGEFS